MTKAFSSRQSKIKKIFPHAVLALKVYFVYRTLGDWLGPESQLAAEGAYCAGDQGKFWEYHDALFNNQDRVSFSASNLLSLLCSAGNI
ncbi:MAG TPA: hypothetical protein VFZ76_00560 [Anaerolineales bacterium]